jgi:channel protein (hemolysin III family)
MTHLFSAGIFAILGIWLVQRGRDSLTKVIALSIFAISSVFLLSMSGVFHLLEPQGIARDILQRLDHAGIFFLIAGTFTAVHGILFRGLWRWGMLLMIWAIAITAITLKTIYFHDLAEWLGLSLYLGMGWIGAISGVVLYRRFGYPFIKPLVYGALAYTIGAIMEFIRMPVLIPGVIGPHELFHVAVIAGLGYHFAFVLSFSKLPVPVSIKSSSN